MKKIFIAIGMLIMLSIPNFAYAVDCDRLSLPSDTPSSLVIDLKAKCQDAQKQIQNSTTAASSMAEYAELGKKYGVALSEVAKSVGTTVNELAGTPVGMFMLFLVGYKVMGNDLLGVFASVIWFLTMLPLWVYLMHRLVINNRVTETIERLDRDKNPVKETTKSPIDLGDSAGISFGVLIVWMIIIIIAGMVMLF